MPSQVTNYKCPSCTAPLRYDGATGRLECDWCGSSYEVADIEALYAQKEQDAEQAYAKAQEKAANQEPLVPEEYAPPSGAPLKPNASWDLTGLNTDWGADAAHMRTYNCPSCGAELICEETTAATSCPYCNNATVIPGQFGGMLRPDYVIPFKLDKAAAEEALKFLYKGKFFLPKKFKEENLVKELKGIYVPFWLFDGAADADVYFDATITTFHREGEYDVTETAHFNVRRAGSVAFEKIPADASSKLPDDLMDSIEPYDYSELRPFSTAYLPGFMADKYDVTAEDSQSRADLRCENTAVQLMEETVVGYQTCVMVSKDVNLWRGRVQYALFPVWMVSTDWHGRNFIYAMNGQTGKLVGELPTSWGKFWATYAIIAVVLMIIMALVVFVWGA